MVDFLGADRLTGKVYAETDILCCSGEDVRTGDHDFKKYFFVDSADLLEQNIAAFPNRAVPPDEMFMYPVRISSTS